MTAASLPLGENRFTGMPRFSDTRRSCNFNPVISWLFGVGARERIHHAQGHSILRIL